MINRDYFELIEKVGSKGITAHEIAERTGASVLSVTNWLSRWQKRGYLVRFKADRSDEEYKKEREARWKRRMRWLALGEGSTKTLRGRYRSMYKYRIDGSCKEWGSLVFGDYREDAWHIRCSPKCTLHP